MPRRRSEDDSDWTRRYRQGDFDADDAHGVERFSKRSKFAQQMKMRRTADLRADAQPAGDVETLPLGAVIQIHSLYLEVLSEGQVFLCVGRRTQQRLSQTPVVGDLVRLRPIERRHESGLPEAVVEEMLPRKTILMRQNSFRKDLHAPIVANARQMLIVTSILQPRVKWGLVDRMLIAAESGGLRPVVCLNKMDLAQGDGEILTDADAVLDHYRSLGVKTLKTSCSGSMGLNELRETLTNEKTVLAGHSGVGKSSLIQAVAPELDIRVGAVSSFNEKGMHTTTSARRHALPFGGEVIDTPGIRHFGLVDVDADALIGFFPDVESGTAPSWRQESYERILESL